MPKRPTPARKRSGLIRARSPNQLKVTPAAANGHQAGSLPDLDVPDLDVPDLAWCRPSASTRASAGISNALETGATTDAPGTPAATASWAARCTPVTAQN